MRILISSNRRYSVLCSRYCLWIFLLLIPLMGGAQSQNDTSNEDQQEMRALPGDAPLVELQKLKQGGYHLIASVQIKANVQIVWDVLKDCGQALRYVPGMNRCKVLESGPDYDVASHRVKRYRLLPAMDYVFRSDYTPYEKVDVKLLEGDLRKLEGQWRFQSCGERCTTLSYDFRVEAGWLVPTNLERRALGEDVPEMLNRLQAQSEHWQHEVDNIQQSLDKSS